MSFRVTYSVQTADMSTLHAEFDEALRQASERCGQEHAGSHPVRRSTTWLDARSPSDRRILLGRIAATPVLALAAIVASSKRAQRDWWQRSWQTRTAMVRALAETLSTHRMRLAAAMTLEVGKVRLESLGDAEEAADLLRYYALQVEESAGFVRPLGRLSPAEHTRDVLKPYGTFAVVAPFNFPCALAIGMAGAALLAGNAVILKVSEQAAWCGEELRAVVTESGLPSDLLQIVQGDGEHFGSALVRHRGIDGVAFTGSTGVGRDIHRIMSHGAYLRPALLEMGGKNAVVVTRDANLDAAAEGCARSAFGFSGQKCSALSRIYVERSRYASFVAKLVAHTQTLKVDDPREQSAFMGPVIDARAVARFERTVQSAAQAGEILTGGTRSDAAPLAHGNFVNPTVVAVPWTHILFREELFLPLVAVAPFASLDEAIERVNDVDYGLTAGIFSERGEDVDAFMDAAQAGILYANRASGATTGAWPGVQSFCGWKGSGSSGKGGCGPYYVAQFAREQSQTRMIFEGTSR